MKPIQYVMVALAGQPLRISDGEVPAAIVALEEAQEAGRLAGGTQYQHENLELALAALRDRLPHAS